MTFLEFIHKMTDAFPNATVDEDNDGQLVIYTNLHVVTPADNPSIPWGETAVVDMDTGL